MNVTTMDNITTFSKTETYKLLCHHVTIQCMSRYVSMYVYNIKIIGQSQHCILDIEKKT